VIGVVDFVTGIHAIQGLRREKLHVADRTALCTATSVLVFRSQRAGVWGLV